MSDKYGGWTVNQLKKELRNRNAKVIGKKEDLIERLASYDRNDNFETSSSVEKSDDTVGVLQILWPPNDSFSSVQAISTVPSIDIVHINTYFLKVYKFEEGMTMYSAVHRKGFNMMKNYFLLALMESKTGDYIFYHAQVKSEMTKALTYFVKLVLVHDGSIVESTCECVAGKGNRAVCKHVAVVCYALLHFKEHEKLFIRSTCTENKQIWNMPKKKRLEMSPKKSEDLNYSVLEYNVTKKQMNNMCYDPRPACYKNMPSFNDNMRNLVIDFNSRQKRSLAISASFAVASVQGIDNDHDYLSILPSHQMVYNRIQVSQQIVQHIEKATRSQNKSTVWFQERSMRLTASYIGTVIHMTNRKNVESLVDSIINPKSIHSAAIDWGNQNEKRAVSAYEKATMNTVVSCGLFISLDHPHIAASPDGLIGTLTVLEVKCPYSVRESVISADTLPYLEMRNNVLCLKRNSTYYYQVQTQMYVTGREFCDFVIWTPHEYKCMSVVRNSEIIHNEILPKAKEFYNKYMIPALAKKFFV